MLSRPKPAQCPSIPDVVSQRSNVFLNFLEHFDHPGSSLLKFFPRAIRVFFDPTYDFLK